MVLKHLRTTTENVPATNALENLDSDQVSQMQNAVEKEDQSNFTVYKWRNKVLTDTRVRSKLKDANYRVKQTEDTELTRLAAQKLLQEKIEPQLKLAEMPIYVGQNVVIFSTTEPLRSYSWTTAAVKVWNRPGKELKEAKRQIWEADSTLAAQVAAVAVADFGSFWAQWEYNHLKQLREYGMSSPKAMGCFRNILVMEKYAEATIPSSVQYSSRMYSGIVKSIRQLYTAGFVSIQLDCEHLVGHCYVFDAGDVVPRSSDGATELLLRNCQQLCAFFEANGQKSFPSAEATFGAVTGFDYKAPKLSPLSRSPYEMELEIRKVERKSDRAMLREKKN